MQMIGLKEIRKKKNLNQQKIALDLSISREAISYYENGKRSPSVETLVMLSNYFNVSIDYLITGKEFTKKWFIIARVKYFARAIFNYLSYRLV